MVAEKTDLYKLGMNSFFIKYKAKKKKIIIIICKKIKNSDNISLGRKIRKKFLKFFQIIQNFLKKRKNLNDLS